MDQETSSQVSCSIRTLRDRRPSCAIARWQAATALGEVASKDDAVKAGSLELRKIRHDISDLPVSISIATRSPGRSAKHIDDAVALDGVLVRDFEASVGKQSAARRAQ
jgi:hypothetical protein